MLWLKFLMCFEQIQYFASYSEALMSHLYWTWQYLLFSKEALLLKMNLLPQNISVPPVTQNGKNENHNHQSNLDPKMKKTKQCAMRTQHKSIQKKKYKSATGQQKSILQCYLYSCFPGQMGGGWLCALARVLSGRCERKNHWTTCFPRLRHQQNQSHHANPDNNMLTIMLIF